MKKVLFCLALGVFLSSCNQIDRYFAWLKKAKNGENPITVADSTSVDSMDMPVVVFREMEKFSVDLSHVDPAKIFNAPGIWTTPEFKKMMQEEMSEVAPSGVAMHTVSVISTESALTSVDIKKADKNFFGFMGFSAAFLELYSSQFKGQKGRLENRSGYNNCFVIDSKQGPLVVHVWRNVIDPGVNWGIDCQPVGETPIAYSGDRIFTL